jgi:hypothetical protein
MKKLSLLSSVFLISFLASGALLMAQGETLPPHVHGVGAFNVAIEGTEIDIDYDGPLANFISFEHAPTTPEQIAELKDMMTKLKDAGKLFAFPAAWGCTVKEVNVEGNNIPEDILGHPHKAEGDHDHGHGHDHDHGDEGDHHHHDHGDEGDHHHDHGDEGDHQHAEGHEHSDVEVEFSFSCPKLTPDSGQIDFKGLFTSFPNLHDADIQLVRPSAQAAYELSPDKSVIKW